MPSVGHVGPCGPTRRRIGGCRKMVGRRWRFGPPYRDSRVGLPRAWVTSGFARRLRWAVAGLSAGSTSSAPVTLSAKQTGWRYRDSRVGLPRAWVTSGFARRFRWAVAGLSAGSTSSAPVTLSAKQAGWRWAALDHPTAIAAWACPKTAQIRITTVSIKVFFKGGRERCSARFLGHFRSVCLTTLGLTRLRRGSICSWLISQRRVSYHFWKDCGVVVLHSGKRHFRIWKQPVKESRSGSSVCVLPPRT